MKTIAFKFTLLLLSLGLIITSCSKNDDPTPTPVTYDIKGYYKGTFGNSSGLVLLIEDGGKLTLVDKANFYSATSSNIYYGTGYTFVNNVITCSFKGNLGTGSQFTLTANYDPTTGALSNGTIGTGTATSGYSTFTAQRTINSNSDPIGLWYGFYNSTPSNTTNMTSPYTILVEDATHIVVADAGTISGNSNLAYGTYSVTGNTFSSTYKYNFGSGTQYSNGANFNTTDAKLIAGTWGSGTATSGSGNWYLNKIK